MAEIILNTNRLYLKGITPSLIHQLYNTLEKKEIMHFFGFDEANYNKFKDMHKKGMETNNISLFFFLLIKKENNLPIGQCGFHTLNKTHDRSELFYFLNTDADKQKKYMTEIFPVVLDYGFKELGLNRIEALVADYNIPSVKLLLNNGFSKEGVMRQDYRVNNEYEDSHCYSILKSEWEKMQ